MQQQPYRRIYEYVQYTVLSQVFVLRTRAVAIAIQRIYNRFACFCFVFANGDISAVSLCNHGQPRLIRNDHKDVSIFLSYLVNVDLLCEAGSR